MGQKTSAQPEVANTKIHLAEMELTLGNINQANELAQEAIEIFTKLGMKRELRETQALLARITAEAG